MRTILSRGQWSIGEKAFRLKIVLELNAYWLYKFRLSHLKFRTESILPLGKQGNKAILDWAIAVGLRLKSILFGGLIIVIA